MTIPNTMEELCTAYPQGVPLEDSNEVFHHQTVGKGHGRIETRDIWTIPLTFRNRNLFQVLEDSPLEMKNLGKPLRQQQRG